MSDNQKTTEKKDSAAEESDTSSTAANKCNEKKKGDPVKLWTALTIALCIAIFVGHILADKYTPYTSNGRLEAYIVPIAPEVSGTLINVNVEHNQLVRPGQVLAVIDPIQYELAVRREQADLQQASQTTSADISSVTTAQARVDEALANLHNAEIKGERAIKLSKKGAASIARADDARSNIESKKAQLASSRSELEKAKASLGSTGQNNARIRAAIVALETAQLDLSRTSIRAPSAGIITNLTVDVGQYANAGAPIMTFISTRSVWVQADLRENCLLNIKKNDPVELVLDAAPGRIFNGKVMSVGYGVADDSGNTLGTLATVQPNQGWLRQAQHLPVLIEFTDDEANSFKRAGGQVNVIIYTGDNSLLNLIGRIWIRTISFLSHIY